jgi:hypothetical protein
MKIKSLVKPLIITATIVSSTLVFSENPHGDFGESNIKKKSIESIEFISNQDLNIIRSVIEN